MTQEESDSEHSRLVRELTKQIRSLNLIVYSRSGIFTKGFTPDIVTNIGGTFHDWVIIEVINSPKMLKHDLAGLQIVNSNAQTKSQSIRKSIVVINSSNIKHEQWLDVLPLVDNLPNFMGIWSVDSNLFTPLLKRVMRESYLEKIENASEE